MSVPQHQTQGYSLAVDCLNARDFTKGIQHALQYASLRPRDIRVHELLGQLYEAKKDWKRAIESYKTALQIDPQKSKLGLKVVALYCQLPGEVERLKHWTAQVSKKYPDDPIIHHAQECIFKGTNQLDRFADYIRKQLHKDPTNALFAVKLLECLQGQNKLSEALNQCECILDVLHQDEHALQEVVSFTEKLLSGGGSQTPDVAVRSSVLLLLALCYLAQAQLAGSSRTASNRLEILARLGQRSAELEPRLASLDKVMKYPCHKLYISEVRGQFHYLIGTNLLQLALAGSLPMADVLSKTCALYSLSLLEEAKQHNNLINLGWTLTPARILSRLSCGRVGQIWHFLRSVSQVRGEEYMQDCQRKWCSIERQKELFEQAFGRNLPFLTGTPFLLTNEPCQIGKNELAELLSSVFKINQESVTSDPENFTLLLWTCLQWDTREDGIPSDFGHFVEETFSNLSFSTGKLKIMTVDNLRLLDLEAFLYAGVVVARASLTSQQRGQVTPSLEVSMKNLPLLTIKQRLSMKDQDDWFKAVYRLCHSKAPSKEFSKLRLLAQRGLEVLRCGSNHGNETLLLVQLGRVMNERMTELKGADGPGDRCNAYHAMSVLYWTEALGHLKKLASNTAVHFPAKPFFPHVHKDIWQSDIIKYIDEGLVVLAEYCAQGGDIHKGLRYLEEVKSAEGQFVRANLFKQLAREEAVPDSEYQLSPTKLTTRGELLDKAKHALYSTMDGISQNANHPLHEKVRTMLVDIESEQDQVARKIAEVDGSPPPMGNESTFYHSFNGADTSNLGEATNDPSPQRLASEIRALNLSQHQMERDRDERRRLLDKTLDQNQSMMEQQAKLMEHILNMKQQPTPPLPTPTQGSTPQGPPAHQGLAQGGGDNTVLSRIADQNERLYDAVSEMKDQVQDLKKDVSDLKDKISKLELEQEKGKVRELQKQVAAAATVKPSSQTPPGIPSPAQLPLGGLAGVPPTGSALLPPGHKGFYLQPQAPMYHHPTPAGVTYIPHPQYHGYMIPVDSATLHSSMMTSTPSVRRSATAKAAPGNPPFAGLYDNGSSPTDEDEELKQQFGKGFGGLGEPREYLDGSQFQAHKAGGGTPMRGGMLNTWQSPSATGSIIAGTPPTHSPTKPLQGMAAPKTDAASTLAPYAAAASRRQPLGVPTKGPIPLTGTGTLGARNPAPSAIPGLAAGTTQLLGGSNSLLVPKPIVTSVSTAKPSAAQGHLIKSPTPANQATLPTQTKPVEGPAHPSPFGGFSFKAAGSGSPASQWTSNPAFQSPSSTPVTTTATPSPFAGFSFKPSQSDNSSGEATQQYPQLTALLSDGPGTPTENTARTPVQTPGRKPGQSPMGPTAATASPQRKEDKATTDKTATGKGDEVVYLGEEKATPEQIARAEKLMLPPNFYLYEGKPPCPGCVGCDEEDLKARAEAVEQSASQPTSLGLMGAKPKEPAGASPGLFASSAGPPGGLFSNTAITGISFAALSAEGDASGFKKSESSKPFAFAGAGTQLFGGSPGGQRDAADRGHAEDSEYDPHYEPIIALPDKVEVVTGDEGHEVIFRERAKLYRFDSASGAWKERGVGEMKILRNPETGQSRILMRREQVLKVCANHLLSPDMSLQPMSSSDRAWVWLANDFAEGEGCPEQFAIKFKLPGPAAEFKDAFDRMKESIVQEPSLRDDDREGEKVESGVTEDEGGAEEPVETDEGGMEHRFQTADPVVSRPEGEEGDEDDGDDDEDEDDDYEDEEGYEEDDDEYECEEGGEYDDGEYENNFNENVDQLSLADQFQPPPGTWVCDTCMVQNPAEKNTCLACEAPKPSDGSQDTGPSVSDDKPSLADMFRPPAGSWACDTCMVNNPGDQTACMACTTPKPGAQPSQPTASSFSFGALKGPSLFGSPSSSPFSFKVPSGFPSTSSAFSAGSLGTGPKPGLFSLEETSKQSDSAGPTPVGVFKSPPSVGFTFGASKPELSSDPGASAIGAKPFSSGASFSFGGPSINTNANADSAPDSTVPDTSVGKPAAQPEEQKFTFGGPMTRFSFGAQESQKKPNSSFSFASLEATPPAQPVSELTAPSSTSSGFQGFSFAPKPTATDAKGAPSSFAGSSQFNFRLNVDNVATSPPKLEEKPTVKSPVANSPGLNKSAEYYQSDERDDLHFEPVVTLPENVKLETGEEGEEVRFEHRAKLYRWDRDGSQWKERGVGDIKVLFNPETNKYRIVMRREQVLKVCANHFITEQVDLQPNAGSDRSWVWHAMDVSDGEVQYEQLAVRFKTGDAAKDFKDAVDAAKKDS